MKTRVLKAGFAVSALALAVSPAIATELRFDGFASFVAGQVLDKDELLVDPQTGDTVPFRGYDERLSFQPNSLFALQVRADLQEKLSATAQIIAKGQDDYEAKFNWAYLAYQLTNELTVKAGRFRTPLFLYSDFLDVGYAYHWISPPDGVYNLSGFDSSDGVMLEWQTEFSGFVSTATVATARTTADIDGGTLDSVNGLTATWNLNYDWFTFHIAHSEADITIDNPQINQLAAGLAQTTLVSQNAIDNMLFDSDKGTFDGVGISVDTGRVFAVAEYTETASEDTFSADPTQNWYVSGGARFSKLTAYLTYEHKEGDLQEDALTEITSRLDPAIAALQAGLPATAEQYAQLAGLRGGVAQIFAQSETDTDTYSVGLRYDFHPSAAMKFEYIQQDDKINEVEPAAVAVAIDLVY
ncbi:MAG TPA: porin, partial [Dongiaceae bacterium]|nr:porin [Dongiaceae bacterium]